MNNIVYWIGWGICTAIYIIFANIQRRKFIKYNLELLEIINHQTIEIAVLREISKNYTKDVESYKKQIEELKGANNK